MSIEDEKNKITITNHSWSGAFLGFNDNGKFFKGLLNCKLFIKPSIVINENWNNKIIFPIQFINNC